MRSSTTTLISALRILARDIQSEDGVANAAIAEAADRLEELSRENARLQMELDSTCNAEELRQVRAENVKLRERIAFEASLNAELKERLEHKTNSSN